MDTFSAEQYLREIRRWDEDFKKAVAQLEKKMQGRGKSRWRCTSRFPYESIPVPKPALTDITESPRRFIGGPLSNIP